MLYTCTTTIIIHAYIYLEMEIFQSQLHTIQRFDL